MKKSFRYRLYPNKIQASKLQWTLDRCRELYNAALSERKDAYKYAHKNVTYLEQQNALPEIKHEIRPEYQDIDSGVLQNVCRRVDIAFQRFFARCKQGETPGYPRFKGRHRYDSFTFVRSIKVKGKYATLPKIGNVRVKFHMPLEGIMRTITVKREGEHWYIIFVCEVEKPEPLPISYEDVGIDLGVYHLAALSTGETIEHPRYLRKSEKRMKRLQQSRDRKKRGSYRYKKTNKSIARLHRKIARQRRDFLHKESRKLINRFQVIVFEDLLAVNLTKRPKPKQDEDGNYLPNNASAKAGLNKSILDAGWGIFVLMCEYKAEEAGRTMLKVSPKYTSQICSGCGAIEKKDLSERWHSCSCGCELDRDVNAAINILRAGYQPTK